VILNEASLMDKLHDLAASDPPLSLQLAREAVARFPDSPNAPEFSWNLVKALANMGRYEEAEEEARIMVKKYPGNDFAADVDRHLLNHPPNP
jgi:tetratricopeptide (TPR) repeat protein